MNRQDIVKKLIKDIMDGIYAPDGKLPGEVHLAESFGVSRMTLRSALDELRRQGLIEKRNGAGSFLTKRAYRRSGLIGLVIPDYESYEFFSGIKTETERHAGRLGYRVSLVFSSERSHETLVHDIRRKVRELAVERAEGVIFRPFVAEDMVETNKEIVNILHNAEIPVVLIDSDITRPPNRSSTDLVAVSNVNAGRVIANHLHGCGYRRIAFLMQERMPFANANWSNRLFGLAGELALLGCEESVRQLDFAPTDERKITRLLRSRNKPDAIVCGNDEQAIILIDTLSRIGRRVPDDVAVVGFDDIAAARETCPPLTTISQPVRKLAATAFKTLLARIRYPNNDPREILLDAPLVVRRSTLGRGRL
jgi:DNA-binding LacI/PurR family transcriptional regulator